MVSGAPYEILEGMVGRTPRPIDFDLNEMLSLRVLGWSSLRLGQKYRKDHSTILYHCKRHKAFPGGVEPKQVEVEAKRIWKAPKPAPEAPKRLPRPYKYAHLLEEKINPGKASYADYEAEAMKRPAESAYRKVYGAGDVVPHMDRRNFIDRSVSVMRH